MRCAPGQKPMYVGARQLALVSADSRLRKSASAHPGELRPPGPPACAALPPLHPAQHSLHFPVPARQDSLPRLRTCIGRVDIIGVINDLSQVYLASIAAVKVEGCWRVFATCFVAISGSSGASCGHCITTQTGARMHASLSAQLAAVVLCVRNA